MLLEMYLESKLKEHFNEDQINTFYQVFKENFNHFKGQNADVCDNLLDFLDFQKFKATMLQMKDALEADGQLVNQIENEAPD